MKKLIVKMGGVLPYTDFYGHTSGNVMTLDAPAPVCFCIVTPETNAQDRRFYENMLQAPMDCGDGKVLIAIALPTGLHASRLDIEDIVLNGWAAVDGIQANVTPKTGAPTQQLLRAWIETPHIDIYKEPFVHVKLPLRTLRLHQLVAPGCL